MRKQLVAMTSSAVLGVVVAATGLAPTVADPISTGGHAADTQVIPIQFQGQRFDRGGGGGGQGMRGPGGGRFESRGQVQTQQRVPRQDFRVQTQTPQRVPRQDFRVQTQRQRDFQRRDVQRRDFDRRAFSRREVQRQGRIYRGPRLVHRGWDRRHRHRFFGAFLVGIPFGYAAISAHPCYDWIYGPQGWGYYWNYDRCPV